ncbi:SdpI family protein [Streptomyces sp. AJS327]|uniref:SdpI family protein n=1 Tax=Streptomyces sp. AJS327 TaxID=2545265 RepID=UPI0015DEEE6C|nr:SdpI family protein [Streptomyces sp. AJS327]MBA0053572.1 SdpI family protein [Streptomyces sp. AJS327]
MTVAESAPAVLAVEPMPVGGLVIVMLSLVGTALLTGAMGLLGQRGRLRPNGFFGIRTRTTRASEANWYHVHRRAARGSLIAGGVLLFGTVLLPLFPGLGQVITLGVSLVLYVGLLLVATWRAQRGLATN